MTSKKETVGERIRRIRGEMSQADFGALKLNGVSQSTVSAYEVDDKDRTPSAVVFVQLAALSVSPEDANFFLEQARLNPETVASLATSIFKRGDVPLPEEIKSMVPEYATSLASKVFVVPPFEGQSKLDFDLTIPRALVNNESSIFYLVANSRGTFGSAGSGVDPNDILVFERKDFSMDMPDIGEKVLAEFADGLHVGRLGYMGDGGKRFLVIGPSDVPPDNWALVHTRILARVEQPLEPPRPGEFHFRIEKVKRYFGLWVAQFGAGAHPFWKKRARVHAPKP